MGSTVVALIAFACFFGAALLGMTLRKALPEYHLNEDSKHSLGLALGIVGTMAGLVLGLLVASATASYNAQRSEVLDAASKILTLDRILAHYGPAADPSRAALKSNAQNAIARMWPQGNGEPGRRSFSLASNEAVVDSIENLAPTTDQQRSLKAEAIGLTIALGQIRWLMYEQADQSISVPLLVVLIFWFTITFLGFGIFSPANSTVIVALALCALAVSGAIFVTLQMYMPFQGLVQISSAPLRDAVTHLGR